MADSPAATGTEKSIADTGNEPLPGTPAIGQLPEFLARHRLHGIPLAGVEALVKRRAVLVAADELHRLARRGIEPDNPYVIT